MIVNITKCPICNEAKTPHNVSSFCYAKRQTFCKQSSDGYYHTVIIYNKQHLANIDYYLFSFGDEINRFGIRVKANGDCSMRLNQDDESYPIELKPIDILDDNKVNEIFETLKETKLFE